mgnify:CR=1 FL=1
MTYVNQFLIKKELPAETRMKVRRYLDYVFEQKKDIKIDESDIFKILNEALREKVHMILRGRVLKKINFMEDLGLDFLSELASHISI